MVMTFVLHPLFHYNSITEPRARFLLSLLEHFTIDFPSHFHAFHSLIPHFHAFHSLKPKFLGFLQNLGFLKIKGVIVETLGWFFV